MNEPITASTEKPTLRIAGRISLLLVIIGFFLPIFFNTTGFGFLNIILKSGNINIVNITIFVFFISTLLGGLLLIPLVMKRELNLVYDWITLVVSILCCVFLTIVITGVISDSVSDVIILRLLTGDKINLQFGGYLIFIGLVVSLITLSIYTLSLILPPHIKTLIKNNIRNYSMFIMLALIMIIFIPLTGGNNWNERNITNIFFQYSYVLILAVGMVMVIIVQGIDLSVGSVCALVGALSTMIYNTGAGTFVTLIAALLMGGAVGAYQGAWVAYGRLPSFIVTLSGMQLFRGLTYLITKVTPVNPHDTGYSLLATGTLDEIMKFQKIGPYYPTSIIVAIVLLVIFFVSEFYARNKKIKNEFEISSLPLFITKLVLISFLILGLAERFARYRGLPIVALILGITIFLFHFILNNTVLGRYIYAVGGNPRSAKLSGINSELVTFIVFCFMGIMTGLAAVVSTGYMNSALPQAGNLFELDAIAACYIGGVSAGGGIGSVIGVIVGGFVMSSINNGMSLMNLGTHYQYVVRALILLFAVFFDVYSRRKAGLS